MVAGPGVVQTGVRQDVKPAWQHNCQLQSTTIASHSPDDGIIADRQLDLLCILDLRGFGHLQRECG